MRLKHRTSGTETAIPARLEPMAESIISQRRPYGFFSRMSDAEMAEYSKALVQKKGATSRNRLLKADSGLYRALEKRGLLDVIGLPSSNESNMDWAGIGKDALAGHAKKVIAESGISSRKGLKDADPRLYYALWRRKMLDGLGLEKKPRHWAEMGEEDLLAHAKKFIADAGLVDREGLRKAGPGLYKSLWKSGLLDRLGLEKRPRDWAGMEKAVLLDHAKKAIAHMGIRGRTELEKADPGLYKALRKRKLLDVAGFDERQRDWAGMQRGDLLAEAKKLIAEKGITGRRALQEADNGLYHALWRRKLLDKSGLGRKQRDWAGMRRADMIALAKHVVAEQGLAERGALAKADRGLYDALKRRKLLDRVFSNLDSSKHSDAVKGVLDALDSFGDEK